MFDNAQDKGDNHNRDGKNENYETWHIKENIVDKDCEHSFILDGECIGNMVAWSCKKCKRGRFLPLGVKITN